MNQTALSLEGPRHIQLGVPVRTADDLIDTARLCPARRDLLVECFITYTITNVGTHAAIIKGVVLETGYTKLDGNCVQYSLSPLNCKYFEQNILPCRLTSGEFTIFYFEADRLATAAHERGNAGHLAGFRFHCQDSRGNDFTSKNWSFFGDYKSFSK
ncbi:MAG: hypothetical protein OXM01_17865 [Gemmatimonadota bacterium]|nr:hypothetical protein [Gemmatimonadota bacterium]